ncbi:MAG TPA: SDR family NAD(P)-dependent oxidoreductase [Acetobacteraceae bacterium]|jgi:NAD(P)-dependent dehydrogenase (short-subunit alcohol dehydrogenase family)|nr:SDR family NAD(P)-dependent oxidoreductase [Acetobacteraceae bacterium]
MQLEGASAIVTGGGSGLGAATAAALAQAGARVTVLDINAVAARDMAARIGGLAQPCDVADAASAAAALAAAEAAHGAARVLVNCAGVGTPGRILGRDGPIALEAFARVVQINLIGSFNMLRLAAAAMATLDPLADGERGVVVNTASIAAFDGQVGQAAYAASKGGIASLTLPAARELARVGIRVMTVAPGIFETPMLTGLPPEVQASLGASVPFPPRLGRPEEFAELVLHIISNRMLNGEVIRLDGALRMAPR